MILYMAVTCDEYELPAYVTESAEDLARWLGISIWSVRSNISRHRNEAPRKVQKNGRNNYRLRKVIIEEDESQ